MFKKLFLILAITLTTGLMAMESFMEEVQIEVNSSVSLIKQKLIQNLRDLKNLDDVAEMANKIVEISKLNLKLREYRADLKSESLNELFNNNLEEIDYKILNLYLLKLVKNFAKNPLSTLTDENLKKEETLLDAYHHEQINHLFIILADLGKLENSKRLLYLSNKADLYLTNINKLYSLFNAFCYPLKIQDDKSYFSLNFSEIDYLMASCYCNNLQLAKLFIKNGWSAKARDFYGNTALIHAVKNFKSAYNIGCNFDENTFFEIVKLLLSHGADINAVNNNGESALSIICSKWIHMRCEIELAEIVEFLLENGASVTEKVDQGNLRKLKQNIENHKLYLKDKQKSNELKEQFKELIEDKNSSWSCNVM